MKIHEYQAAELFKKAGIPVPQGRVATELSQAKEIAGEIGFPLVLKSQVLVGGRGKAGGIKLVKNEADLEKNFLDLKKLVIKGYPVRKILVSQAVELKKEYYFAITIDNHNNDIVLIASRAGGVEIEEVAKTNPEKIHKFYLNGKKEIDSSLFKDFIKNIFDDQPSQEKGAKIFQAMLIVFIQLDCSIAEINPLVIDGKGVWHAVDAKINFDDNAAFRHPEFKDLRDMEFEDADEIEAKEKDLNFVKMEGNVGCVVNGAGLAMATMDVIKLSGGEPANFLDVGGSSNPDKVVNALKIILRNKEVKAVLINIFGGITRCDDIANGLIKALDQIAVKVPLVVRLTGTNEKEAKEILAKRKIPTESSMRDAVKHVVELAKK